MERNVRDIRALIEEAFVDIRRDEDCTLHQSQFSDTKRFPDSVVFHLTYSEDSRVLLLPRFTLLDAIQQNATVAFLEFVREHPRDEYRSQAAAGALTSYRALPAADRPTDQILLLDSRPRTKATPE